MLSPNFSDINKNGFRIYQFRIVHSPLMRGHRFTCRKKELKVADDLIGERNLLIEYLVEQNEINYTLYFFSARILVALILIGILTLLLYSGELIILRLLPMISATVFYFLSIRLKESFVMSNFGIQMAESIYQSKIAVKYNL
jgi:hypothetical protein